MATEVEERIVAAKFDSSQFEKGVDKTVKKLDELKESLDFKKTGESLEKLGKKTTEATESASKSLEKLSDRFTTFTGMLKQKLLGGLADQVVNVFFRMEHAITGFVRSMSVGQMGSGMQKFESILTSVRMITNATYDEIDKITGKKTGKKINYTEDSAYAVMEQLRTYTDETSYSMDQMTDAMSKMVAAGVGLDQATKNVQGIANAAAAAGVNATDAARAFFNLSQAYSSGSLKYTDYRSLELLNMTNQNFEEQLLAAGVAAGTLKESKDAKGNKIYKTVKSKTNSKVTAGKKVTREGLAESLKYGWAGKDVMDELFGQRFYVDVEDFYAAQEAAEDAEGRIKYLTSIIDESKLTDKEMDKIMKSLDETDEHRKEYFKKTDTESRKQYILSLTKEEDILAKLPKKYSEVAAKAFLAAREARNFNDVIRAVQEYVSSKWSKIFEHLFGRLEQASQFFTDLAEGGIAEVFMKPMDWLSDAMEIFDEGGRGSAEFQKSILLIDETIGILRKSFAGIFPTVEDFGEVLFRMAGDLSVSMQMLRDYAQKLNIWLNDSTNGVSRIDKLRKSFADLSGVFMVIARLSNIAFTTVERGFELISPIIDAAINALYEFTTPIGELGKRENIEPFERLQTAIDHIYEVVKPIIDTVAPYIATIGTWVGKIAGFILDMSIQTAVANITFFADAISLLFEVLSGKAGELLENREGVIGSIAKDIDDIGAACASAINTVKEFFGVLIKDIRTLLGLPAEEGQAAADANQEGGLFAGVKNFFETNEFIQQAQAWVEQAKNDIIKWFGDLPQTISNFINGLLYKEETTVYQTGGYAPEIVKKQIETPLKQWLDTAVDTVAKFIADIPTKLLEGIGTIGNFVSMVINAIFGSKDGAEAKKDADTKKQEDQTTNAVKEWADKFSERFQKEIKLLPMRIRMYIRIYSRKMKATWKNLKTWFNNDETIATIKEWGASIFNAVKDFILKLPEHITNLVKTVGATGRTIIGAIKELFKSDDVSKETQKELEDGFNGINIQDVLNTIADIGKEIVNQFLSWFTGSEDMAGNFEWLGEQVSNMIKGIPAAIEGAVDFVILKLGDLWNNLYKALVGEKDQNGKDEEPIESRVKQTLDKLTDKKGNLNIGISNIVDLAKAAFGDAEKILGNLWHDLSEALTGKSLTKEMQDTLKGLEASPAIANDLKKQWASEGFNVPGIKTGFEEFVSELGAAIVNAFSKIPGWITEGLNVAVTGINTALEWLTNNLSANIGKSEEEVAENVDKDDPAASGLEASFTKLGTNISNLIFKTIPGAIAAGFERVKNDAVTVWWPSLLSIFDGINNDTELQEQFNEVGTNIVAWIDALPKRIKEAFYTLKLKIDSFFHPDAMIGDPRFIGKEAKEALDKAGKETKDDAEQSTLWDTIKSIVANIGDAFKRAFDALWPDVSSWFANLPTHIVEGLTIGINTIGDAFDGIGTFFDQLVNSKDAEEMATKAMEDAQKATEEGVEKGADNKDQQSSFVTAITGLGSAIWKVITESIPKAITGAFNWVRDNWDSWIDSLRGIFSAVTGTDIGEIDITTIVNSIRSAIESLPEKISSAWATVKEQINKIFKVNNKGILTKEDYAKLVSVPKKETKDIPTLLPDFLPKPKDFAKDVKNQLDETGTEVSKEAEESSLFDTLLDVGKQIGSVLSMGIEWAIQNIGPILMGAWEKSLKTLSTVMTTLGTWFSKGSKKEGKDSLGNIVENVVGDEQSKGFKDAVTNIGNTITSFFTETLPFFIGTAIGKFLKDLPTMAGKLLEGVKTVLGNTAQASSEVMEESLENVIVDLEKSPVDVTAEKAAEAATKVLNTTTGVIDTLVNALFTKDENGNISDVSIWAKIAFVALVLEKVTDLINSFHLSISDPEATKAKNSITGIIRVAIEALMVGMVFATLASQMNADQFDQAMTAFGKLGDLIKTIMESATWLKGFEMVGEIAETVGDFASGGGVTGGLVGASFKAAKTGGIILLGSTISKTIQDIGATLGMVGVSISTFANKLKGAAGTLVEVTPQMESMIGAMRSTVQLLEECKNIIKYETDIERAKTVIEDITSPLSFFAESMKGDIHAKEVVDSVKELLEMTGAIEEFVKWQYKDGGEIFNRFKYSLSSLGSAISLFSTGDFTQIGSVSDIGINNAIKFVKNLLGDEGFIGLASQLTPDKFGTDAAGMQEASERLIVFASAIARLGSSVVGFTSDTPQKINDFFEGIQQIKIYNTAGETTDIAEQMLALGTGLTKFAEGSKDLTIDNVEAAGLAIEILEPLSTIGTASGISSFANGIELVGDKLKYFYEQIKDFANPETIERTKTNIHMALNILTSVANAAGASRWGSMTNLSSALGGDLGTNLKTFVEELSSITSDMGDIDKAKHAAEILKIIGEAIGYMGTFQISSNLDDLGSALFYTNREVVNSYAQDVEHGMIPTLMRALNYLYDTLSDGGNRDYNQITTRLNVYKYFFMMISDFMIAIGASLTDGRSNNWRVITDTMNGVFTYLIDDFDSIQKLLEKCDSIDITKLNKAKELFAGIKEMSYALSAYGYMNGTEFIGGVNAGLLNLENFDFELLESVMDKFISSYTNVFNNERNRMSLTTSGYSMASVLAAGIQEAFNDPGQNLQPHITPILELDQARSDLAALFGTDNVAEFNFGPSLAESARSAISPNEAAQIDYTVALSEINSKLDKLSRLDSIDNNTGAIIPAFAGAKLIVDTNALAVQMGPAMDRWLATAGYLYLRHNS